MLNLQGSVIKTTRNFCNSMKKIGILTFHRSINYGAFMQAYAFSHMLQKRYPNHIVEIIDFEYLKKHKSYRKPIRQFPFGAEYYIKYTRFQKDLKRLTLSPQSFITETIDQLSDYIKSRSDVVIVGSDAVWTYQGKMPIDNPYWLMGGRLNSVSKFSYAASAFSTDFSRISKEERSFIREQLSDFSYVGVRDVATQTFIKELRLGQEVFLNHDPSLFLEPAEDKNLARKVLRRNFVNSRRPSISFMTRQTEGINSIRERLHSKYNLLHFNIRDNNRSDFFDTRCRYIFNMSPYEWYNVYALMTLNITNFFHGACLALVNHIPTIVIDDSNTNYVSKYAQLMLDMGLEDRLFYKTKFDIESFMSCVNTCLCNPEEEKYRIIKAIEKERLKSKSFFVALDRVLL